MDLLSSVRQIMELSDDKEVVLAMLDCLYQQADENIKQMKKAEDDFATYLVQSQKAVRKLDEVIEAAWEQMDQTENKIVRLSNQICRAQAKLLELDKMASLGSIDSRTVNDCKEVYSKAFSICYSIIVDGLSLPYLSTGMLVHSFGNAIYQIIHEAGQFEQEVKELQGLSSELSIENKILVQSKTILRLLYALHEMVKEQRNSLEKFIVFWQKEKRNLETVRSNIVFKQCYNKENPEVMQLPVADTVWKILGQTAVDVLNWLNNDDGQKISMDEKMDITI